MMDEHDIHHAYAEGDMTFREAILRLRKLGYDRNEADQIVCEWANAAEEEEKLASDFQEDY